MPYSNKKMTGITKKLVRTIIPLIAAAIIIMMSVNYASTKDTLIKSARMTLQKETSSNVNTIEVFTESTLASLARVYDTLRAVSFSSDKEKLAYLATTCNIRPEIPLGVYIADNTNYWMDPSGFQPDADYQVSEQSWYQEGISHDTFAFGEPYTDDSTDGFIVSATALLSSENNINTVIAADVELTTLSKDIANITVMDSGYCFLADTNTMKVLAHKDTSLIGASLSGDSENAVLAAAANMAGSTEYTLQTISADGKNYMVAVQPVENTGWILVSCIDEASVLAELSRLLLFYIGLSIVVILLAAVVIWRLIYVTVAPVKKLTGTINNITDGDFTVQIDVKGNDEISVMSAALSEFVEIMREVIKDIRAVSDQLNDKSEVSNSVSKMLNETASSQADSMGDMQVTIEQLANAVTEIAQNASTLAQAANAANSYGTMAGEKMNTTVSVAGDGHKDMDALKAAMDTIVSSVKEVRDAVSQVGESTESIHSIVNFIISIAEQTNLLSLNASIEAARAGEAGRGFAVVAGEIGTLADNSSKSAAEISTIIEKITGQVNDMIQKTESSVAYIEDSSSKIEKAYVTFGTIFEDVSTTGTFLKEMLNKIQNVDLVASNMAALSQEQSASTEEILASTEILASASLQLSEESSNVSGCADIISDSAFTLAEHMRKFKI